MYGVVILSTHNNSRYNYISVKLLTYANSVQLSHTLHIQVHMKRLIPTKMILCCWQRLTGVQSRLLKDSCMHAQICARVQAQLTTKASKKNNKNSIAHYECVPQPLSMRKSAASHENMMSCNLIDNADIISQRNAVDIAKHIRSQLHSNGTIARHIFVHYASVSCALPPFALANR